VYDGGITGCMKLAHAAEGFGLDIELHLPGPAQRHLMVSMRNTNYYEMALVHPGTFWGGYPQVFADDYRDGLDAIDEKGCVHVPAGPFLMGGDPLADNAKPADPDASTGDFFIARHETTFGEYFDFLNDRGFHDAEAAWARAPRAEQNSEHAKEPDEHRAGGRKRRHLRQLRACILALEVLHEHQG
jgi:formylglycine-generating enzyme required for sulfatase activity